MLERDLQSRRRSGKRGIERGAEPLAVTRNHEIDHGPSDHLVRVVPGDFAYRVVRLANASALQHREHRVGAISAYQIAANGALTLLPGSTPAGGPNAGAVDARLSPDGGFLYVDQAKAHAVAAFAVNGGNLTQLGNSPFPLPGGAAPAGIVAS